MLWAPTWSLRIKLHKKNERHTRGYKGGVLLVQREKQKETTRNNMKQPVIAIIATQILTLSSGKVKLSRIEIGGPKETLKFSTSCRLGGPWLCEALSPQGQHFLAALQFLIKYHPLDKHYSTLKWTTYRKLASTTMCYCSKDSLCMSLSLSFLFTCYSKQSTKIYE